MQVSRSLKKLLPACRRSNKKNMLCLKKGLEKETKIFSNNLY